MTEEEISEFQKDDHKMSCIFEIKCFYLFHLNIEHYESISTLQKTASSFFLLSELFIYYYQHTQRKNHLKLPQIKKQQLGNYTNLKFTLIVKIMV